MSLDATENPLSGLWKPSRLDKLYYGPHSVRNYLLSCLPSEKSKVFIVTGSSLVSKTSLIAQAEKLLDARHAGTAFIKQHAPAAEIDQAFSTLSKYTSIDTVISIGGGSPIDSAKVLSHYHKNARKSYLYHICIPTTLSAAECTMGGAYTTNEGTKTFVIHPDLAPKARLSKTIFTPSAAWCSQDTTSHLRREI